MRKEARLTRSFEALVRQARLVLLLERVWPLAVALSLVVGLFLTLSFAGLWLVLPEWLKRAVLGLFALAVVALLMLLLRPQWPSRREALARLDADSGLAHPVAAALEDRPVDADATALTLWAAYRAWLQQSVPELKQPVPRLNLAQKDPYALRFLVILLLYAACFVAGPEKDMRLNATFDLRHAPAEALSARVDGWITPPAYTRRPPVMILNGAYNPEKSEFSAPAGSVIHLQGADMKVEASAGLEAAQSQAHEQALTLAQDAKLTLTTPTGTGRFTFHAIPDRPPTIRLLKVEKLANGKLHLTYKTDDDYGVVAAKILCLPGTQHIDPQPLVAPPTAALTVPPPLGIGQSETTIDLSDDPWAGAEVQLVLSAQDGAGQEGRSVPLTLTLPEPKLTDPLARAVMEQSRHLILTPDTGRAAVHVALDALLVAPEDFPVALAPYLGLREAYLMLGKARLPDELRSVAQILHDVALDIENKGLSPARQALKSAEKALREALQNHASADEIAALMQNLRAALAQVLREAAQNSAPQGTSSRNAQILTPEDLKDMLDRLQDMAKSGDQADVEALLDQLDALTLAPPAADAQAAPLDQARDALDRLTQEQQNLRDKTYRQGLQPQPENEAPSGEALAQSQRRLRQSLDAMKQALKDAGETGDPALDAAEEAMRQSEQALDTKNTSSALDAQGKALEHLHRSITNLAQRQTEGEKGQGRAGQDPLGRDSRGNGRQPLGRDSNRQQADIIRQRSEEIYREIQRRAQEMQRPLPERSYLDRLLHDF